jgi:hypothetical protein
MHYKRRQNLSTAAALHITASRVAVSQLMPRVFSTRGPLTHITSAAVWLCVMKIRFMDWALSESESIMQLYDRTIMPNH